MNGMNNLTGMINTTPNQSSNSNSHYKFRYKRKFNSSESDLSDSTFLSNITNKKIKTDVDYYPISKTSSNLSYNSSNSNTQRNNSNVFMINDLSQNDVTMISSYNYYNDFDKSLQHFSFETIQLFTVYI